MKNVFLCFFFALVSMSGWAQDIMGKWMTEAGDAQVEIYQQGGIVMFPACSVANLQSFFL